MMFRIQSFKQAAFWSTVINAFSQALSLIFSMVMAAVFGAQESTDVLYYCLGIIALLSGLFQVINVSVLIPESMRRQHQIGEADAMAFINRFFVAFGLIVLGLTVWLLTNPLQTLTAISRFSPEALARNTRLVIWLLATLPFQIMSQLLLDVLVSYKFLTLPAMLSCISRVINILFVWLFHRHLGMISMALGLLLGLCLQILLNMFLLRHIIHWSPFVWRTKIGGAVFRNIAWTEIGTLVSTLAGYVPLYLFSGYSAGALTALNYARRLAAVPTQLMTTQISNVTGIKFNEEAACHNHVGLSHSFDRIQRMLIFILVPTAFILALIAEPLILVLYGRGAFGAGAVRETVRLFSVLIMVLPLEAINNVASRINFARQEVAFGTRWQILGNLIYAAIIYVFVQLMGTIGFPIGTFVFYLCYLLVLAQPFSTRMAPVSLWPTMKYYCITVLAAGIPALVGWGVSHWLLLLTGHTWLQSAIPAGIYAVIFFVVLRYIPPDRLTRNKSLELVRKTAHRLAASLCSKVEIRIKA